MNQTQKDTFLLNSRYVGMQIPYWMGYSTMITFASVFLLSRNFTSGQIGVVLALANLLAVLLQPSVAAFADRTERISLSKITAGLALIILIFSLILLFLPHLFLPTALIYIVMCAALMVLQPLTIALGTFFITRGYPLNFGLARGIGSLSFAAASAVVGWLVDRYNANVILYVLLVVFLLFVFAVLALDTRKRNGVYSLPYGQQKKEPAEQFIHAGPKKETASEETISDLFPLEEEFLSSTEPSSLLYFVKTYRKFMMMLVGISLLFAFHNILNTYLYQIVQPLGGTASSVGTSLSIAAACELPTMFLFNWLHKRFPCKNLMRIAALFFTVKAILMLTAHSVLVINIAQVFQMFSFALHTAASVYYTNQIIAPKDQVKGQALMTTANTVGGVLGNLLGGQLLGLFGVHTMLFTGTCISAIGTLIVFFSAEDRKTV